MWCVHGGVSQALNSIARRAISSRERWKSRRDPLPVFITWVPSQKSYYAGGIRIMYIYVVCGEKGDAEIHAYMQPPWRSPFENWISSWPHPWGVSRNLDRILKVAFAEKILRTIVFSDWARVQQWTTVRRFVRLLAC